MDSSQETARRFYQQIRTEGLKKLADEYSSFEDTKKIITPLLNKQDSILDLCCGYGRLTIPLALEGYKIQGLDISKELLTFAKKEAQKAGVLLKLRQGDMCDLPYDEATFDKVLCLWNSFNHLLYQDDQLIALKQIYGVLKPKGVAVIELFYGQDHELKEDPCYLKPYYISELCGANYKIYVHSKESLIDLFKQLKINTYSILFKKIGKRKRIILWITK